MKTSACSACRDGTLKNQPNQMGMTPHYEGKQKWGMGDGEKKDEKWRKYQHVLMA